jgi:signal peptide peptidase SppA
MRYELARILSVRNWYARPEALRALAAYSKGVGPSVAELQAAGLTGPVGARAAEAYESRQAAGIAVLPLMGLLTQRGSWYGSSMEGYAQAFKDAVSAAGVQAIVLLIDSPGGEVSWVEELAMIVRAARGSKPIIAVASCQMCSAAYYIGAQADELFVTPSGEAGSIGVWNAHEDWSVAYDQFGVKVTLLYAGEHKVDGNPFEPLSDEAKAEMQAEVDRYYAMFVGAVSKGRKVPAKTIQGKWQAKIYGAPAAVELGLADKVGTLDDAIARAAQLGRKGRSTSALEVEDEARMRARR